MWILKFLTQLVLSHIPGGERVNYYLQVRKGSHDPETIAKRLRGLASIYGRLDKICHIEDRDILEIGSGWDAINALVMYLFGARTVHTFDIERHARVETVRTVILQAHVIAKELSEIAGIPEQVLNARLERLRGASNLDAIFSKAGIHYHAPADATQSGLPDSSIDMVISYAVLAHLSPEVLESMVVEMRRVLKHGGVAFHGIGMQDPYCDLTPGVGRIRFLKYSNRFWSVMNLNRFNYNNRMREQHYIDVFRRHGADFVDVRSEPDQRALRELTAFQVAPEFRNLSREQLAVCFSEMTIRFRRDLSNSAQHASDKIFN